MQLIEVTYSDKEIINRFIQNLGSSSSTFRYFNKRDITCVNNHLITCMVIENGEPIAYGHLDKEKDKVWLGVCVIENKKSLGLGTIILNYLIAFAKRNFITRIHLTVDKHNTIACKLYKKYGFVEFSEKQDCLEMILTVII